jgi:hypothetical protein
MTKDNQEKIQEIREALQKATPGPWNALPDAVRVGYGTNDWICQMYEVSAVHAKDFENAKNNAHLIANAPEWLKWQNEQIETLQQQLDAAKQENERKDELISILKEEAGQDEAFIQMLQQRLKQAEDVLAWYGDGSEDGGERARTTLSLIREEANKEDTQDG